MDFPEQADSQHSPKRLKKNKIKTASLSHQTSPGLSQRPSLETVQQLCLKHDPWHSQRLSLRSPSAAWAPWTRCRQMLADRLSAQCAARQSSAWEEVGHTRCKSTAFLASSCNHCTHTYAILKTSISNVYRSISFCLLYRNHVCIRDQSWEDWFWMVLYVCNWDAWDREELGL